MPTIDKIKEPILVRNPHTGRFINVAPLFDTMADISGQGDGAEVLKKTVSQVIRQVNLSWDGDATVQKNVNFDLYMLEDMFGSMAEFKQG